MPPADNFVETVSEIITADKRRHPRENLFADEIPSTPEEVSSVRAQRIAVLYGNQEDRELLEKFQAVLGRQGITPIDNVILRAVIQLMPVGDRLATQVRSLIAIDARRNQEEHTQSGSGRKLPIRFTDEDSEALSQFKTGLNAEKINVSHTVNASLLLVSPDENFSNQVRAIIAADKRRHREKQAPITNVQRPSSIFVWNDGLARLQVLGSFLRDQGIEPNNSLIVRAAVRCTPADETFKKQVEALKSRRQKSMGEHGLSQDDSPGLKKSRKHKT